MIGIFTKLFNENASVGDAAKALYGNGATFDTALPQFWVDQMRHQFAHDVRGHFVWLYRSGSGSGMPAPLTVEGIRMLWDAGGLQDPAKVGTYACSVKGRFDAMVPAR